LSLFRTGCIQTTDYALVDEFSLQTAQSFSGNCKVEAYLNYWRNMDLFDEGELGYLKVQRCMCGSNPSPLSCSASGLVLAVFQSQLLVRNTTSLAEYKSHLETVGFENICRASSTASKNGWRARVLFLGMFRHEDEDGHCRHAD